jgi:ubiquitin-protein ligase
MSKSLPEEHTNAIYVRCDKERVDVMKAMIMGSNGTPYAHGAFIYDIFCVDEYPNKEPKV